MLRCVETDREGFATLVVAVVLAVLMVAHLWCSGSWSERFSGFRPWLGTGAALRLELAQCTARHVL